jgi:hypothetical protein
VTEQLLPQQLESPSGTGRVEPRSRNQPVSYRHQPTGCQPAQPILTGSSGVCRIASFPQGPSGLRILIEALWRWNTSCHPAGSFA